MIDSDQSTQPVVLTGDYVMIIDAPPILEKWRGKRAQVIRYIEAINHYEVHIDDHRILLSRDEMIITENDPAVETAPSTSMRSISEIRAKVKEISAAPPLVSHGPVWKAAVLTALLWVLGEKTASALDQATE